jgi:DNA-binding transcriptional ArsR family regulator
MHRASDFNVSELARSSEVSRPTTDKVIKKLAEWQIVDVLPRRGNMTFYRLRESSPLVTTLMYFDRTVSGGITLMQVEAPPPSAVEIELAALQSTVRSGAHMSSTKQASPVLQAAASPFTKANEALATDEQRKFRKLRKK